MQQSNNRVWSRFRRMLGDNWQEWDVFYATPYGDLERFIVIAWWDLQKAAWQCDSFEQVDGWNAPSLPRDDHPRDEAFDAMIVEQYDSMVDTAIAAAERRAEGG